MSVATAEPNAVRAEVNRVVASKGFARAVRLAGFLRFVVEQSLEGRAGELKETSIGVEVFGRPPDYDPKQDSVVRTEAGKLRTRLAEYYGGEGAGDPIVIELPKGGYAPAIRAAVTPARSSRLKRWRLAAGFAAVLAGGVFLWRWAIPPAESPSIAVLPFVNMTGDPENDYLSDGLTEEITDRLANTDLRVIARTSSSALRAKGYTVREIGAKLNAGTVLEGSVRKQGDRVKITAQLIRVADETHILSRTFDHNMQDLFGLQADVAAAIVQALRPKLSNGSHGPPDQRPPGNPEAYQLYLRGLYFVARERADSNKQGIECFEQAIAKDPGYARAYAGLAKAYLRTAFYEGVPNIEFYPKARSMVVKALDMDQDSAEAHAASASLKWRFEGDKSAAEGEFQRALALNPDSEETLLDYGYFLLHFGRLEEGVKN
jgi:TolB-like protein